MPRLFPVRVYELTYRMLEHAVHGELAELVIINLTESADTCQLRPIPHHVRDIVVTEYPLDLNQPPDKLLRQIDALAQAIVSE